MADTKSSESSEPFNYAGLLTGVGAAGLGINTLSNLFMGTPEERMYKKQKADEERKRKAMLAYLQANMPNFDPSQIQQYDPNTMDKNIMGAIDQQQANDQATLMRQNALQGRTSGVARNTAPVALANKYAQTKVRTIEDLKKAYDQEMFNRYVQKYQADAGKVNAMAQLQG